MLQTTPLHTIHQSLGAKLVAYTGWEMPLTYISAIREHMAVRQHAGIFDVSHMLAIELTGEDVISALQHLLCSDISRLQDGQARYSAMLNEQGGIVDDVIVYRRDQFSFLMVVNAGNRDSDAVWIDSIVKPFAVQLTALNEHGIIAVQGPKSLDIVTATMPNVGAAVAQLHAFSFLQLDTWIIARTGYTGEDGVEMIIPNEQIPNVWNSLVTAGAQPCGLACRDSLRVEAGLALYGSEMNADITPFECGLHWLVNTDSQAFVGREALLDTQPRYSVITVVAKNKGMLRVGSQVYCDDEHIGVLTSAVFSPVFGRSIGIARIQIDALAPTHVAVRDDKRIEVICHHGALWRAGKPLISVLPAS